MNKKAIYLLIGPKGGGKSFVGKLLEGHFGITFIRVEDWAKAIKKGRRVNDASYLDEIFHKIENGVRQTLLQKDEVTFESTGLSDNFDRMLTSLRQDFSVIMIRIQAGIETCLHRVKIRDQASHIDVSDVQVTSINRQVLSKQMDTDYLIDNECRSVQELVTDLSGIVDSSRRPGIT